MISNSIEAEFEKGKTYKLDRRCKFSGLEYLNPGVYLSSSSLLFEGICTA